MPMLPPSDPRDLITAVIREDWGRILASLTRSIGNLALAEDCLQDAVVKALSDWAEKGVPRVPAAWLITVARRRALDRLRRDATLARHAAGLGYLQDLEAQSEDDMDETDIPDERLSLIFACCHPGLDQKSQVALTLRALGGLATEEIAAAFLDTPGAMARRVTRAKEKIARAGIPFKVPNADQLADRLSAVTRVIYLIFNEGYRSNSSATLFRTDLTEEAIRLGRIMLKLLPEQREVAGLLALMLLHDARRSARVGPNGAFVPLEQQNRARWDRGRITEGRAVLARLISQTEGAAGPYALQAAISALHLEATSFAQTDWAQIALLYDALFRLQPNAVVRINQAVAISYAVSPAQGLKQLEELAALPEMKTYQPFHAAYADLQTRAGNVENAAQAFAEAIGLTTVSEEREYLQSRLDALGV